jgi:hypothetical protein
LKISEENETRKQVEEEAKEDLERTDEEAAKGGGARDAAKLGYLKIKLTAVLISGP